MFVSPIGRMLQRISMIVFLFDGVIACSLNSYCALLLNPTSASRSLSFSKPRINPIVFLS